LSYQFCQKNEHQGAWSTCEGGVEDARNPVTEAVSDIRQARPSTTQTIEYSDTL
jgi:hypothetical protein